MVYILFDKKATLNMRAKNNPERKPRIIFCPYSMLSTDFLPSFHLNACSAAHSYFPETSWSSKPKEFHLELLTVPNVKISL